MLAASPKYDTHKTNIIIFAGKGGSGKSFLVHKIALELTKMNLKIGVFDADLFFPSQPFYFEIENELMSAETNQHGITTAFPVTYLGIEIVSMGFVHQQNNKP